MVKAANIASLEKLCQRPPDLSHLKHLTTKWGAIQHTLKKRHDLRFGYSIDDSNRALITCAWYAHLFDKKDVEELIPIYARYLNDAQLASGRFHNYRDAEGHFIDEDGGSDVFGRSIWAIGTAQVFLPKEAEASGLDQVYVRARPAIFDVTSLRSLAYIYMGARLLKDEEVIAFAEQKIAAYYYRYSQADWHWFEPGLYYANGIIPHSLFSSEDVEIQAIARRALKFLNSVARWHGVPAPIGNRGWYLRGSERALYDQQCIDAMAMVLANATAYMRTHDKQFFGEVAEWVLWFHGLNTLNTTLVTADGGCYDGIGERDVNLNQGAESTIAYLMSHLMATRLVRRDATILL